MNKTLETSWTWLKRRNMVGDVPYGEVLVFGATMAILGYFYQHEVDSLKRSNNAVMRKLLGGDI
jgi:hypothetical protein